MKRWFYIILFHFSSRLQANEKRFTHTGYDLEINSACISKWSNNIKGVFNTEIKMLFA
jgi:hypothetical protein